MVGGLVYKLVPDPFVVMGVMLLSGLAVGAVNGAGYVYGRLPHAFIMTLATLSICRGLALEFSVNHTTMRGMPDLDRRHRLGRHVRHSQFLLRRCSWWRSSPWS